MGLFGKLALASGLALAVLAGVLVWRTITFEARAADFSGVALADAPPMDFDLAAQHLSQAVQIPTISMQDSALEDMSQWQALRLWAERTYPAAHAVMRRELVAEHTLMFTWQGSEPNLPPIVLMAHQDVVPVLPGTEPQWKHPPFSGAIADGAIWGRGSVDDKGSMVALLESVEALVKSGFQPKRTIIIINGHDEETLQTGAKAAAQTLQARGIKAEFVLDEGLLTIADFPLLNRPTALIGIAEKGYASLRVSARGSGGHSSMPPAKTAVERLATALLAILANPDQPKLDGAAAATLQGIASHAPFVTRVAIANQWLFKPILLSEFVKTPAGSALVHTTMAPTMLSGSPKENVLPEEVTGTINYRLIPGDTADQAMERARQAIKGIDVSLSWQGRTKDASPVSSTESAAWKIIAALAGEGGTMPVAPSLVLAATDSYQMLAVTENTYRYQPIVLSLAETSMVHGTNEHMTLDNLKRLVVFYTRLIATAAAR